MVARILARRFAEAAAGGNFTDMRRVGFWSCCGWVVSMCWVAQVSAQVATTPGSLAASADVAAVDARALFEEGRALYDAGAFSEAAKRFEASYAASGRAELLYNIYLAYRDENQLQRAADALRRYLAEVPDAPNRQALLSRLRILDGALAGAERAPAKGAIPAAESPTTGRSPAALSAPEQGPASQGPSLISGAPPPPATRAARSEVKAAAPMMSWILMVGGGVLLAGGAATGLLASADSSALKAHCSADAPCDPAWEGTRDRGQLLAVTTDALLATGLVVATAGLVWWLLSDGQEQPALGAGLRCMGTACAAGYQARF